MFRIYKKTAEFQSLAVAFQRVTGSAGIAAIVTHLVQYQEIQNYLVEREHGE